MDAAHGRHTTKHVWDKEHFVGNGIMELAQKGKVLSRLPFRLHASSVHLDTHIFNIFSCLFLRQKVYLHC